MTFIKILLFSKEHVIIGGFYLVLTTLIIYFVVKTNLSGLVYKKKKKLF